jgi:methylmalonyl-CoA carboxyltransferase large subunit
MKSAAVDGEQLTEALGAIRQEVARLGERVAALEAAGMKPQAENRLAPTRPTEAAEEVSEELILVISAAVAAFLGLKPHIRQIRLVGTTAWAQQGRVTIQASHALSSRHARSQP